MSARILAFVCLTLGAATAAQGQRGQPPFDGPRAPLSLGLSDGEPVSFYLEWSRLLDLTEEQRGRLIEIRRKLRIQNAPFMRQLDSLREYAGIDMGERRRLTDADREALQRFQTWAAPVIDSIRINNDGARADIRTVLAEAQLTKADSIANASRDPRNRRTGQREGDRSEARAGNPIQPDEWARNGVVMPHRPW